MAGPETIRSTIQKRDAKGRVRHGAEWLALWSDPDSMKTREERGADREINRMRRDLARRLAAAGRGLSDDAGLQVSLETVAEAAGLDLSRDIGSEEMSILRGQVDDIALFLRHHDADLHRDFRPADAHTARLFDLLERLRCGALGALRYPGVADNLVAAHRARLARLDLDQAHLASLVPLAEALRMVVRDELTGRGDPSIAGSGFWMWDRWLRDRVSPELAALAAAKASQSDYARAALALIAAAFDALQGRAEGPVRRAPTPAEGSGTDGAGDAAEGEDIQPGDALFADDLPEIARELLTAAARDDDPPYRVFTTEYDVVERAAEIGRAADLRDARRKLEDRRAAYRRELSHLVVQLQRRLMALQQRSWRFDLEEGMIDAARLDRVIVNPGFADAYKAEEESSFRDTAVTLLIDNSGSMRGKPIELACIATDMVAAALERCGVAIEVLGFTTTDWRGGQPAKDWARAGKPGNPGRLNALRHVVYKAADEPLRRARDAMCLMLSGDVLKENIDGEALAWAARRLSARPEARRVLIVVSDGTPVDEATLKANDDPRILDHHLRDVIAGIERGGQIELAALGIKHDVSRYYRHAVEVSRVEDLGPRLVAMLDTMVAR
ncbi:cobaltochelatase subunit CobT [Rhodobacterales bacterium HKCCE2091]|nr:cobaltochelatase subunit CobT [Rhodobacterales bacterium HKCCE2091]